LFCSGCWGTAHADQEIWKTSFSPNPIELDYVITQAFAKKFKATLSSHKVPFARRLFQLKTGEIDLLSGLLKKDDRGKYAYFIDPPYKQKTNKCFFMRKGEGKRLQKYEDLYQLSVGVQIGSKYFSHFDEDTKVKRYATSQDESRFQMLLLNRFDALIHTEMYGTYTMHKLGLENKLEIAPYRYTAYNPVYIAISYKSRLIERKDELEAAFRKMVESGEMDQIIHQYFTDNALPLPDYK
jgi:polar amino acid transport system substrate-binding protein